MVRITYPPDIIPVTEGKKREDAYGGMLYGMNPAHEMKPFFLHKALYGRLYFNPEPDGLKDLRGEI